MLQNSNLNFQSAHGDSEKYVSLWNNFFYMAGQNVIDVIVNSHISTVHQGCAIPETEDVIESSLRTIAPSLGGDHTTQVADLVWPPQN